MKHYVPEDAEERLAQLNEWLTNVIYSEDFFDDERWLPVRMNITKWKSKGYALVQRFKPEDFDFESEELMELYYICNAISEIMLFEKESREAAAKQQYEKATLYRDFSKDRKAALTEEGNNNSMVINFFKLEGNTLILKCIDQYFIQQTSGALGAMGRGGICNDLGCAHACNILVDVRHIWCGCGQYFAWLLTHTTGYMDGRIGVRIDCWT